MGGGGAGARRKTPTSEGCTRVSGGPRLPLLPLPNAGWRMTNRLPRDGRETGAGGKEKKERERERETTVSIGSELFL